MHAADGRLRLKNLVSAFSDDFDLLLIDTQGARSVMLELALLASDLAISPITPDMLAAREFYRGTQQLLKDLEPLSALGVHTPPLNIVINKLDATNDAHLIYQSLSETLTEHPQIKLLDTTIPAAVAFRRAATQGLPAHRLEQRQPHNRKAPSAFSVIHSLAREVFPEWQAQFDRYAFDTVGEPVAPALRHFTEHAVQGLLWDDDKLPDRDRSIVTLAVVIARNHTIQLKPTLEAAVAHGVKATEISEIITHLAFYAGWGNAMAAVLPALEVFNLNGIDPVTLPPADDKTLPLDEAGEAQRAKTVASNFGEVAPGMVQNTTDYLFRNLWLRPALAPRDRSLVTVSALVAAGQVAQVPYHLNRAMDNGLTRAHASEVLTQLAFHAGWPNVFSAMPVFKEVFANRG